MEHNESYIANDTFARNLGITLVSAGNGASRCELTMGDEHKNGLGSLHGAVIFALADVAFAAACNSVQPSIGMQADIRYLNRPLGATLIAEAHEISGSNKIAHYQVNVSDDLGSVVAQFTGMAYRFPKS
jgi:acyl-CoA thioesterase